MMDSRVAGPNGASVKRSFTAMMLGAAVRRPTPSSPSVKGSGPLQRKRKGCKVANSAGGDGKTPGGASAAAASKQSFTSRANLLPALSHCPPTATALSSDSAFLAPMIPIVPHRLKSVHAAAVNAAAGLRPSGSSPSGLPSASAAASHGSSPAASSHSDPSERAAALSDTASRPHAAAVRTPAPAEASLDERPPPSVSNPAASATTADPPQRPSAQAPAFAPRGSPSLSNRSAADICDEQTANTATVTELNSQTPAPASIASSAQNVPAADAQQPRQPTPRACALSEPSGSSAQALTAADPPSPGVTSGPSLAFPACVPDAVDIYSALSDNTLAAALPGSASPPPANRAGDGSVRVAASDASAHGPAPPASPAKPAASEAHSEAPAGVAAVADGCAADSGSTNALPQVKPPRAALSNPSPTWVRRIARAMDAVARPRKRPAVSITLGDIDGLPRDATPELDAAAPPPDAAPPFRPVARSVEAASESGRLRPAGGDDSRGRGGGKRKASPSTALAVSRQADVPQSVLSDVLTINTMSVCRRTSSRWSEYARDGAPWTAEEEGWLIAQWRDGSSVESISRHLCRTRSAVKARLKRHRVVCAARKARDAAGSNADDDDDGEGGEGDSAGGASGRRRRANPDAVGRADGVFAHDGGAEERGDGPGPSRGGGVAASEAAPGGSEARPTARKSSSLRKLFESAGCGVLTADARQRRRQEARAKRARAQSTDDAADDASDARNRGSNWSKAALAQQLAYYRAMASFESEAKANALKVQNLLEGWATIFRQSCGDAAPASRRLGANRRVRGRLDGGRRSSAAQGEAAPADAAAAAAPVGDARASAWRPAAKGGLETLLREVRGTAASTSHVNSLAFCASPDVPKLSNAELKALLKQAGCLTAAACIERAELQALAAANLGRWEVARLLACEALPTPQRHFAVLRLSPALLAGGGGARGTADDGCVGDSCVTREARAAFLRLSLQAHPDKCMAPGADVAFHMLQAAFEYFQKV